MNVLMIARDESQVAAFKDLATSIEEVTHKQPLIRLGTEGTVLDREQIAALVHEADVVLMGITTDPETLNLCHWTSTICRHAKKPFGFAVEGGKDFDQIIDYLTRHQHPVNFFFVKKISEAMKALHLRPNTHVLVNGIWEGARVLDFFQEVIDHLPFVATKQVVGYV